MGDNWDTSDWEPKQKEQKTIYSQSFSRGGGSGRRPEGGSRFRDRNDRDQDFGSQQNRGNRFTGRNSDRGSYQNREYNAADQGGSSKTIQVNTVNIGKIIGKGGSNIRNLEQDTGAKINVNKGNRGETTEINLTGTDDQIALAEQKINDTVSDSSSFSRPYERNDNSRQYERNDSSRYDRNDSFKQDRNQSRFNSNYSQSNDNYQSNNSDRRSYSDYNRSNNQSSYQNQQPEPNVDQNFELVDWNLVYQESDARAAAYLASLPPIVKKLYEEDPEIANMSPLDVAEFRLKNMNISVSREFAKTDEEMIPVPNPVKTFEQAFRPYPDIMKTIYDQKFETPSPIQSQAWPVILSGEDMIGIAQTGTGKTLAFLLPAMIHIEAQPTPRDQRVGPTVVVLSPTRELAQQIEKEINKYSYHNIKCVCIYGGGDRKNQIKWLREDRPEIIVATPGRLDDLMMAEIVKLDSVTYVVLDEADKMLEMGFECQIRKILINIRSDRQSIMTSATWPSGVRRLASQYSVNPVQVVVGSLDLTAVHSVTQRIEIIDEEEKRERLDEFIREMGPEDKVIVFCGKKSVTDDISSDLVLRGIQCQSLHGDREQCDREQALHDLKTGAVRILIATDVAARGLDIVDITHVFNYDFPKNIEEYVHRIGRTGRAGRKGESVSLFTRRDWANAADLIKILEEANQGVPEELFGMAKRFEAKEKRDGPGGGRGRGGRGGGRGRGRGGGGRNFY